MFEVRDGAGRLLQRVHNIVTNVGLAAVLLALTNEFAGLNYVALGTSTTTPAKTNTQLGTELVRVLNSRAEVMSGTAPELTIEAQFRASDVTAHIREVALFGGASASSVANSGTMFNHAVLNIDNTNAATDLTITAKITVTEKAVTP